MVTCCVKVIADCPSLLSTSRPPIQPEKVPKVYLIKILSPLASLKTIGFKDWTRRGYILVLINYVWENKEG